MRERRNITICRKTAERQVWINGLSVNFRYRFTDLQKCFYDYTQVRYQPMLLKRLPIKKLLSLRKGHHTCLGGCLCIGEMMEAYKVLALFLNIFANAQILVPKTMSYNEGKLHLWSGNTHFATRGADRGICPLEDYEWQERPNLLSTSFAACLMNNWEEMTSLKKSVLRTQMVSPVDVFVLTSPQIRTHTHTKIKYGKPLRNHKNFL